MSLFREWGRTPKVAELKQVLRKVGILQFCTQTRFWYPSAMRAKPKVLYIEDDPVNMALVRKLLKREGVQLLEASNGWAGIAMAQMHMPDLVLMDMNMPDMDGYEATRRIKTIPELKHIPVVALTANAMEGDRDRSIKAGCLGHITKPINIDTFGTQVLAFMGRSAVDSGQGTDRAAGRTVASDVF